MTFRTDDRGAAIQIGAVILFAFVVLSMASYQAAVVPDQNAEIEADHNQEVRSQLQQLRNGIVSTTGGGPGGAHSVRLGASYPARTLFVNPGPPSGSLATSDAADVRIVNATAVDEEAASYWNGSEWTRPTRSLTYAPNYNEYGAPTTVYEHTLLYDRHPNGANLTAADQALVDGDEITLVTLRGNLSESRSDAVSVRTRALSASANAVSVEGGAGPVEIVLPTASPGHWAEELADEPAVDGIDAGSGTVRITLAEDEGPYTLRMAEIGVGDARRADPADRIAYLAPVEETTPDAVVEVRDALNNPVRNAEATVTVDGETSTERTGSDGRVRVEGLSGGEDVTVEAGGESASFTVRGSSGAGSGSGSAAYDVRWADDQPDLEECADDDSCDYRLGTGETAGLTADSTAQGVDFDFAYREDGGGIEMRDVESEPEAVEIEGTSTGAVEVYVSGGGSSDALSIEVAEGGGTATGVDRRVDDLSHGDSDRATFLTSYDVTGTDDSFQRVEVEYANLDGAGADRTVESADRRGSVEYEQTGAFGDDYEITLRVIETDGDGNEVVAAERTVADAADADNPSGNEDLSASGGPQLRWSGIEDRSNNGQGPRFRIDYDVGPTGQFGRVDLSAVGIGSAGADRTASTAASDTVDLGPGYGNGERFKISVLVVDADGAVVDHRIEYVTAAP